MQANFSLIDSLYSKILEDLNYTGNNPVIAVLKRPEVMQQRDVLVRIASGTLNEPQEVRDYARKRLSELPSMPD